jgi:hypothetical protein
LYYLTIAVLFLPSVSRLKHPRTYECIHSSFRNLHTSSCGDAWR